GCVRLAGGIFEVRKNYGLLLDVWEHLIQDSRFDLDLVIVGRRGGSEADALIARLEASPLYRRRIFWLRGLGDSALSWLYERCHVALQPSFYEGWGLPVVEALQHRRPVIAADRGGIPEAAMGQARLIDPDDVRAWYKALADVSQAPRASIPPVQLPSWDDPAASIRT